ncbi:hypothetical protein [Mesorhizobium sp. M7A.F.Ca.CA.004.08.2.1]|uniref:hypothetical protein n=1 Tax=Mesorhizobium sp. M7A.F.Ca.CA.004.08.2.1 TaxID=2496731 RepID=UPI000FD57779|nr:hypothetical protein [Mesorhizobium sp. M7A.F.Ca.CA.004.08.2.1]RUX68070.1 hypothetical protein EN983_30365 [Mesorhizobium sp. M7A.F.Ca.CA.004.08.2.1]
MFDNPALLKAIFGRLTLESLPLHEPIVVATFIVVALGGIALTGGRGGMLGAAAAGTLLFLIQTLFTLAQVSIFYIQIMYGLILLVALTLNAAGERARRGRMTKQLG